MQVNGAASGGNDKSDKDAVSGECAFPPIPRALEYLIEPAIRYGRKYPFDADVEWFLANSGESAFKTLATLAERARISGDYAHLTRWLHDVGDAVECIVDKCYPYTIDISERRREELLRLINEADDPPGMAERWRETRLRRSAEANDRSEIAECRKEMRMRLLSEANDQMHHMDIYFLFGLMDACDLKFE
jgi:hypothetical protein